MAQSVHGRMRGSKFLYRLLDRSLRSGTRVGSMGWHPGTVRHLVLNGLNV